MIILVRSKNKGLGGFSMLWEFARYKIEKKLKELEDRIKRLEKIIKIKEDLKNVKD